jgi:hypothetical protein
MSELTESQKRKLLALATQIDAARDEVEQAYETTLMSDAKTAVYFLWDGISNDKDIPEESRSKLLPIIEAARTHLLSSGTTEFRAGRCSDQLSNLAVSLHHILVAYGVKN